MARVGKMYLHLHSQQVQIETCYLSDTLHTTNGVLSGYSLFIFIKISIFICRTGLRVSKNNLKVN